MATDIIYTPPTLKLPNLDAMSKDKLWAFWKKWHVATRTKAVALVGVRKGATRLAQQLANYALHKTSAIQFRLDGKIVLAQNYETVCEQLYQKLPEDLRW